MPKDSAATFSNQSKTDLSLLKGWFSKLTLSAPASQQKSTTIKASTRGRDKREDRVAIIERKPRGAEIRRRGRELAISNARQNTVGSSRRSKKKDRTLSLASAEADDNNYYGDDEDDDAESSGEYLIRSLKSSGSNYSILESLKSSKRSVSIKEDSSSASGASGKKNQTLVKKWQETGTPLESVMKRPSIYSWYSASLDSQQAIISIAEVSSTGSRESSVSTQSTASENIVSRSSESGSLKIPRQSLKAIVSVSSDKMNPQGRKRSVGSKKSNGDDDGSKLKDFLEYFPWLNKLRRKKRSIDEKLAGMDIEAAAAAGKEEERRIRGERASGWLQVSSSDSNFFRSKFRRAAQQRKLTKRPESHTAEASKDPVESASEARSRKLTCEFIVTLMPLFRMMQLMGRFPIEIKTDFSRGKIKFRLDYKSRLYWAFYGTSILIGLAFVSLTIQVAILPKHLNNPTSSYQEILHREFEKYWVELTLTGLSLFTSTASNLAFLHGDSGSFLVDFLNRWTYSITLLQNDVTVGLKKFLIIVAVLFCIYAATFTVLFFVGRNESVGIPICRDSSGVIFLFMIDNIFRDLRLTAFYATMEYIGLFIHLYVSLSITLMVTLMLTFCIILNNAATQFHVKLEESLCKDEDEEVSTRSDLRKRRMTTIRKSTFELGSLFQEHLAVNSLARQFGGVFTLTLKAFVFAKIFGCLTAFYSLLIPLFTEIPHFTETFLDISSLTYIDQDSVIPIRNQEPELSTIIKGAYYCFENVLTAWIVLEIAQRPGAILMESEHYVRKRGLIFCKNSKERRFISSMLFSFSPRIRWALHPGINLTREFLAKLWGFVLIIALTLVQFNHTRTSMNVKLICDKVGVCTEVSHVGAIVNHAVLAQSMSFEEVVEEYAEANQLVIRTTLLTTAIPTTTTSTTSTTTPKPTTTPAPDVRILPCLDLSKRVNESEILEDCGDGVLQPYLFSVEHGGFKKYRNNCKKTEVYGFHISVKNVYDCYGNAVPFSNLSFGSKPLQFVTVDECRNNPVTLPKTTANLTDSVESALVLQAIYLSDKVELLCCYKYGGLGARNNPPCNLASPDEASPDGARCEQVQLPVEEIREQMEFELLKIWKNDNTMMDTFDEAWTSCVCEKDEANCEIVQDTLSQETVTGGSISGEGTLKSENGD